MDRSGQPGWPRLERRIIFNYTSTSTCTIYPGLDWNHRLSSTKLRTCSIIQDKFAQLTWLSISPSENKWVEKPDYNSPASDWNRWIIINHDSCSRCIAQFDAFGLYGLSRLELWDFFDYIPQPDKLPLNHLWNNDCHHHRYPRLTCFGGNRRQCYHPWCLILRDLAWNLG